jgi:hypothetical protein
MRVTASKVSTTIEVLSGCENHHVNDIIVVMISGQSWRSHACQHLHNSTRRCCECAGGLLCRMLLVAVVGHLWHTRRYMIQNR